MSPTRIRVKRDDCDVPSNNCHGGIRPTTYATSIALIIIFASFACCFVMRRRRRQRFAQSIHIAPLSPPHPQQNYAYNQPPTAFFEPAPPYDATKAPPLLDSAPPPPHSPPPEHSNPPPGMPQPTVPPVQYPPPSYSPA